MPTRSVVFCYAPQDEAAARELGDFLALNLAVEASFGECVVTSELPLHTAVENALSAPWAVVLLSPDSVPTAWKRAEWERAFLQAPGEFESRLAIVLLRDCNFPAVLRREKFFDLTTNRREGERALKQWLIRPDETPRVILGFPELRAAISDGPGVLPGIPSTDATAFLAECAPEFEAVCHINAAHRTDAGILGDIGHALGITLPDNVVKNRELLEQHFATNRVLLICDGLTPEREPLLRFGGLASVVITEGKPQAPDLPSALAPVADLPQLLQTDFATGLRLGWKACDFLSIYERHAEKIEVLEHMETAARRRADAMALYRIVHELSWLRDDSRPDDIIQVLPTASSEVRQLPLFN